MSKNLVNLTVNPCKMCMPMGAVQAFYGISRCMTLLHGSQGCSTYIRRHMATHYNEPVDIASSSLTEEGTVYGGEKKLIQGIENLIRLYDPEVIGIASTCLAETIGEDMEGIVKKYQAAHPESRVKLIAVPAGGYMGTQYEGFFKTLHTIVKSVAMTGEKHNRINIVTGMMSPADVRLLKDILDRFGLEYILFPDVSGNLDGGHHKAYQRLPVHGTTLEEISRMAGSRMTIEFIPFIDPSFSPGAYLQENFGVPVMRLNPPVGLRETDALLELLSKISEKPIPEKLQEERARYLDAMIDSHKYNAEGRAVVFGEPDFVLSVGRLCCENGIVPVVCAAGTYCPELESRLEDEVNRVAGRMFVEEYRILHNTDFEEIEELALSLKANLLIGSSDGRRIEEKHHIPLIRAGFPVHDRVGGQRIQTIGYQGSLRLLDEITNTLLESREKGFRKELYNAFCKPVNIENPSGNQIKSSAAKTENHPCFSCSGAHKYARIHLPVAPKCNISCNYCVRKYDCANESRPGVTTRVLTPGEAVARFMEAREKIGNLTVVGIAGPGDALADFEKTRETLKMIRTMDKEVTFCLSTNGLVLPRHAEELAELGVSHVTITINAIDPEIGSKIYHHVDYLGTRYVGAAAAAILISNQLGGLKMLADKGIACKVNIVALQGINDHHIEAVARKAKELGACITNIMQMIPVKGSRFENLEMVSLKTINALRKACEPILPQMYHCRQCRADAAGLLSDDRSIELFEKKPPLKEEASSKGMRFAVASKSGMLVDQHFGHATEFLIYEYRNGIAVFSGKRSVEKYCGGSEACNEEEDKIGKTLKAISDCDGVIALRIGAVPQKRLEEKGIKAFMTYDRIEDAVKNIAKELSEKEAV